MVKNVIWFLFLLLMAPACSDRTDQQQSPNMDAENESFVIDYPLDSLLSFDSESALKEVFKSNVVRSSAPLPEGMGVYPNTLLFPNSQNEVEFIWKDTSNLSGLLSIEISEKDTEWKTKEGITIGTGLQELEALNGQPFTFYGLGWDYAGVIIFEDGQLAERKISGSLSYPGDELPTELEGLLGDIEFESSSALAQRAGLVLDRLSMMK